MQDQLDLGSGREPLRDLERRAFDRVEADGQGLQAAQGERAFVGRHRHAEDVQGLPDPPVQRGVAGA